MPNIRKVLDLSTAHLPEHLFNSEVDGDGANVDSYHWGTVVYPLEHGALLWVPDDPGESAEAGTQGETTQADVLRVQVYARSLGCDYVLFDADADEDPRLPTWNWGDPTDG